MKPRLLVAAGALGLAYLAGASALQSAPRREPREPPLPAAAPPPPVPAALGELATLELVTRDTIEPLGLVAAPGEPPGRLFVVEKRGRVRILRGNKIDGAPFLDLTGKVSLEPRDNGEQGLLGLAFHPRFPADRRFYVDFTDLEGHTRVVEMKVDERNAERADPASGRDLLAVPQPHPNHNAGDLSFGPDGKLYVLLGDGGGADDTEGNAQNPQGLLGKAVRLDVEAVRPEPEVLARGLRNPWRASFDPRTGDLYIADVGQRRWEWVHVVPAGKLGGQNFGWNRVEGRQCFLARRCDRRGLHAPAITYSHREGCSITGGYVYRGKALPELEGAYFYSDYCTGLLRSFRLRRGKVVDHWDWKAALDPEFQLARVASFGVDQEGELYLVSHEGPIYKLVRRP